MSLEGWQSGSVIGLVSELWRLADSSRVTWAAETTILEAFATAGIGAARLINPSQNDTYPQGREFKEI
jgi:hypothetical protein|tara:strand:- start:151 stop:354 length:204 start_codon:yes stop_codon:yes gene_type:complete